MDFILGHTIAKHWDLALGRQNRGTLEVTLQYKVTLRHYIRHSRGKH